MQFWKSKSFQRYPRLQLPVRELGISESGSGNLRGSIPISGVDLPGIRSNSVRNGSERLWIHSLVIGAGICGVGIVLNSQIMEADSSGDPFKPEIQNITEGRTDQLDLSDLLSDEPENFAELRTQRDTLDPLDIYCVILHDRPVAVQKSIKTHCRRFFWFRVCPTCLLG